MSSNIEKEIRKYQTQHKKSLELWKEANQLFPGGVSHNIREFNLSYFNLGPPFIEKALESKLYDIDGNIYTDYWLTHGAAILGHAHKAIENAIKEQLPKGIHYGTVNESSIKLAKEIIEATPSIKKLKFCTTGTEATMYASRLARAFTGRKRIAKVKGGWHGGNDTLFYYVKDVQQGFESKGLKALEDAEIISFDYNATDEAIKIIRENKKELAAVIMEPVLGAGGAIPPRKGFLESIREETKKSDILLIYDEIITGFRLSYHSAQGMYGIVPDISTMGKIVGGGTPIGIIGGREDIMEQANLQKGGQVWVGGGTFSANPVSMVAGIATLNALKKGGNELYKKLNNLGEMIRKKANEIFQKYNASAIATGVGSMISIHWFKESIPNLNTGTEVKMNLNKEKVSKFQILMFNRGQVIKGGFGYLSIKHTEEEIKDTLNAIEESTKIIEK